MKDEYLYRPLGGGIEFGEPATKTVCRELKEELDVEVDRESSGKEMPSFTRPAYWRG